MPRPDDAYEKLRQRLDEFPVPCPPGKGVLEFLRALFSPREAELLAKFTSFQKFVTAAEFAREHGVARVEVENTFHALARRNLIRYQRAGTKETYCPHPLVIGLYEAFFSTWEAQDPATLEPAARAIRAYFDDAFHRAVSNSSSPWARVLPALEAVEAAIQADPALYDPHQDGPPGATAAFTRTRHLLEYGGKQVGRKLVHGKVGEAIDVLRKDGPLILEGLAQGVGALFGWGRRSKARAKSPAESKPKAKPKAELKAQANAESETKAKSRAPGECTVVVEEPVPPRLQIHPYEVLRTYVDQASEIVVASCSCRLHNRLLDETRLPDERVNCPHPVEDTCMQLRYDGEQGHPFNMMGGRVVSKAEAFEILAKCERAGLVHNTFNSREKVEFICNCCPCCCGILGTLTRYGQNRRAFVESNFLPRVDLEACTRCGACARRCPVGAIAISEDAPPVIHEGECIGCGVCVTACPQAALSLEKVHAREPALDAIEAYARFANNQRP